MKNIILLIAIASFTFGFSQDRQGMRDKIKAQKIAFITDKLELTVEESKEFWPIYNRFEETTNNIKRNDLKPIKKKMKSSEELSNAEADALLNQFIEAENEMHTAKVKMMNDLKKVISSEKIIRLKAAEDEFNRKLLERLREYRKNKSRND
ncbi:hypothetical protein [Winogradskyella sp. A3E31]|uniref:hypothetical protein n=1 Tax=Winogradskyella sp. A3E31 TaxID=3349637 RepID=UPI00398B6CE0